LREFLINSGGYYTPPLRDLTNDFCKVKITTLQFLIFLETFKRREETFESTKYIMG